MLGTTVSVGLVLGVVGTAWGVQTFYCGTSGANGTIPAQGAGASTPGVAPRIQNKAQAVANCSAGGKIKAYYITSGGGVHGSVLCAVGSNVAVIGGSGGTSVYSRCSTDGAFTIGGKCWTDW